MDSCCSGIHPGIHPGIQVSIPEALSACLPCVLCGGNPDPVTLASPETAPTSILLLGDPKLRLIYLEETRHCCSEYVYDIMYFLSSHLWPQSTVRWWPFPRTSWSSPTPGFHPKRPTTCVSTEPTPPQRVMEYLDGPRTAVGNLWVGVGVNRWEGALPFRMPRVLDLVLKDAGCSLVFFQVGGGSTYFTRCVTDATQSHGPTIQEPR